MRLATYRRGNSLKIGSSSLKTKVHHYITTNNIILEGYELNNGHLPTFQIPIDDGYYVPAKWIKLLPDEKV
jgi:hypothetical protein